MGALPDDDGALFAQGVLHPKPNREGGVAIFNEEVAGGSSTVAVEDDGRAVTFWAFRIVNVSKAQARWLGFDEAIVFVLFCRAGRRGCAGFEWLLVIFVEIEVAAEVGKGKLERHWWAFPFWGGWIESGSFPFLEFRAEIFVELS